MSAKLETLSQNLETHLGERLKSKKLALGEVTIEVSQADYLGVMQTLRDEASLSFDEVIDLCGADYSAYGCQMAGAALRGRCVPSAVGDQQPAAARARLRRQRRFSVGAVDRRSVGRPPTGSTLGSLRSVRHCLPGPQRPAPHLTDYGFIGHPVPQGFPDLGLRRDALRPGPAASSTSR